MSAVARALWRRPRLQLSLLLAGPVGWLVVAYLGSLAVLFAASLWQLDEFSGKIVQEPGLQNFQELIETPVYRSIVLRTVLIAALVTITDAILAFPIAFFMAKVATPRVRALLVVAVLMPLWSKVSGIGSVPQRLIGQALTMARPTTSFTGTMPWCLSDWL